jgi:hypothetical protein
METSQDISETSKGEGAGVKERRRSRRHDCEGYVEAWVSHPDSLFRGEIQDISLTGCFIRTKARLNLAHFAAVDLHFTLENSHFRAATRVIDVRPGKGVGLEFIFAESQPPEWITSLLKILGALAEAPPPKKA